MIKWECNSTSEIAKTQIQTVHWIFFSVIPLFTILDWGARMNFRHSSGPDLISLFPLALQHMKFYYDWGFLIDVGFFFDHDMYWNWGSYSSVTWSTLQGISEAFLGSFQITETFIPSNSLEMSILKSSWLVISVQRWGHHHPLEYCMFLMVFCSLLKRKKNVG